MQQERIEVVLVGGQRVELWAWFDDEGYLEDWDYTNYPNPNDEEEIQEGLNEGRFTVIFPDPHDLAP